MAFAPVFVRIAEVEIAERASNGDMADAELRGGELGCLDFKVFQNGPLADRGAGKMRLRGLRAQPLVAQQHQEIEEAVAERLPAQRQKTHPRLGRKQFWRFGIA